MIKYLVLLVILVILLGCSPKPPLPFSLDKILNGIDGEVDPQEECYLEIQVTRWYDAVEGVMCHIQYTRRMKPEDGMSVEQLVLEKE